MACTEMNWNCFKSKRKIREISCTEMKWKKLAIKTEKSEMHHAWKSNETIPEERNKVREMSCIEANWRE